jgi:hypothetical protein
MMQCAANDEENQKLGIVGLLYHVGDQLNKPDPDLMSQGPATLHWVPIRFNGLHICVSQTMSSILARLLLIGAGREIRCRSRVHYGRFAEDKVGAFDELAISSPSLFLFLQEPTRNASIVS